MTTAIIDTGIDLSHADFTGKIVPGYDFVNGDSIPQDDNEHGTHVAGIAAATGNNGIGIAGVSWGARIMPVKVLNSGGNGSFADVAAGITWAANHGAQVINLSFGGASPSNVLQDAVNYAYGKGVVLVAAAGNTGTNSILYPAHYPNVIAVDSANNYAGFSNFGPELDLVAPGASIYSTVIGGYGYKSGTSMAAPYVSGLAAILSGMNSSPAVITFEMESSALDLGPTGFDNSYGYGLIQMDKALKLVLPPTTTPTLAFSPVPGFTNHSHVPKILVGGGEPISASNLPASIGTTTQMKMLFESPTSTVTSTPLPPTIQSAISPIAQVLASSPTQQEPQPQARSSPLWQLPCCAGGQCGRESWGNTIL